MPLGDMQSFTKALLLGLSVAAPVGPIGLLVVRRAVTSGPALGFVTGLGAAVADTLYAAIAVAGLGATAGAFLGPHASWLQMAGGTFLCWLGVAIIRSDPSEHRFSDHKTGHAAAFMATFLLTITNPLTTLSFAAAFAGLGLGRGGSGVAMVVGVFLGSATWWLGLASAVASLGRLLGPAALRRLNVASGALLIGLGGLAILQGWQAP